MTPFARPRTATIGKTSKTEVLPSLVVDVVTKPSPLRTKVMGDFNIHGTKFFDNAVFHQKSNKYDVVSLPVPLVGQKTCPPREILTWLFITENAL